MKLQVEYWNRETLDCEANNKEMMVDRYIYLEPQVKRKSNDEERKNCRRNC